MQELGWKMLQIRRIACGIHTENIYANEYCVMRPATASPSGYQDWIPLRRYTIRGLASLVGNNTYEFALDKEVSADLDRYKADLKQRASERQNMKVRGRNLDSRANN